MSAVRSMKKIPVRAWVPPTYSPLYKLEVIRGDETVDDITDSIYNAEIVDGVTDTIGNFEIEVDNGDESRTGIWTGNEVFNFYCDYATTATTKRFRGRVEKVSYQDFKIKLVGRAESVRLLDITVTQSYENIETSVVLKNIFDIYATDFTQTNINTSTTSVTFNWYQKPFWECVQDLCRSAGFDAYIDSSLDCHYFESGTVDNSTEAIVHDSNLLEVGDFAQDYSLIKNRIIVYGAEVEGIPLIKTAEDIVSIKLNEVKELIIQDTNITTETQCQERADFELSISKDPPVVGDVSSIGLATIQPGERVRISASGSNLPPKFYKILSYKHKIEGFMKTTVRIEKEPRKVYHILRDNISKGQKLIEMPNPNEMRNSWNFDYNTDVGTHSSTEIIDGVLKTDGSASGTWISDLNTLSSNAKVVELRVNGESLPGTLYSISVDNGVSFQSLTLNTALTLSPPGLSLKLKVIFASTSTQINSLGLLYKQ